MRRLRTRSFRKDEDGGSVVEFVLVFPLFIMLVLTIFEAGWLMTKSMMLDRGMEVAMRDVRLGRFGPSVTSEEIRQRICDNALVFRECVELLVLELKPISAASDYPSDDAECLQRTTISGVTEIVRPETDFNPGGNSELMFVRACMVIDPIFPGMGIGLQLSSNSSGGVQMVVHSAFMTEPE